MNSLPELHCACATVRRASRLITQLYSQELGDSIEPGQFSLLLAIERLSGCTQTTLGRLLGFDKTTVSRSLKVMTRNGWIGPATPAAGHCLTRSGAQLLATTKPKWIRAQKKLQAALRGTGWDPMLKAFDDAAEGALKAQR